MTILVLTLVHGANMTKLRETQLDWLWQTGNLSLLGHQISDQPVAKPLGVALEAQPTSELIISTNSSS